MKLNFPLKTQDLSNWRSASDHYKVSQSKVGGWYPVGRNGFWHGGTHIDGNHPIHAVADGELTAYRVSEDYIDPESLCKYPVGDNDIPIVEFPISDNFVLTKHSFTPPEMKPIVFYVLYMNLLPFNPLKKQISKKQKALPIFFQSRFFIKNNAATKKAGLDIHDNGLSSVTGSVPAGAEVFFETPHEVAEDHQLKPEAVQTKYKPMRGYQHQDTHHRQHGYIAINPSTIEVKKRIDCKTDKVVTDQIPLKRGDIIGFPGGNGALENETSVHMEIFIKDEESYTSLKQYTDKQKKELGLHDEVLLNLENYISSRSIISSVENGNNATDKYCNIIKILNSAYYGAKNGKLRIEDIIFKPDSHQSTINKLRRLVVKTRSEWKTVDGEFDRLKIENGGTHSDKKHKAYLELYQEKLDFWDQLEEKPQIEAEEGEYIDSWRKTPQKFPDEVYFFHPIKFIEHLKLLQNFVKLEYVNEKGRTAKVETIYLVYDEDGNLIHRGRFKNGYAYFKKSELVPNKKLYVWLDERMGIETIDYRGNLYRKYEAKRFYFHEQLYQYLDIPDWETRWKKDRSLEVNGRFGPAGDKNVQRHGPAMNWINRGDILYIPLEEIKVNEVNTFEVEEEWETWQSEETLIQISSHAASTIGPEESEIKGIAASMTSKVVFSNRKLRKAYELQYHVKVESLSEGLDLNLISGAISEAFGSRKFRKGTPPNEVFESYEGKSYVKEFILPTPVVSVSVGSFKGDKGRDGHLWEGSFISGSLGASIGVYMDLVLWYWDPSSEKYEGNERYPGPIDVSDYVFRSDKYN